MNEKESSLRVAESIYSGFTWNGQSFKEGSYVAILDGEVIAVAETPSEAIAALRTAEPDPLRGLVIEVTHPVVDVIRLGQ